MQTENEKIRMILEKKRARFGGREPEVRYRFQVIDTQILPVDEPAAE